MNTKTTMRARVLRRHGGIGDLEAVNDYPAPKAIAGHVVIRVRASSFNFHDVFTLQGMPGIKVSLPVIIGLDMVGEIIKREIAFFFHTRRSVKVPGPYTHND